MKKSLLKLSILIIALLIVTLFPAIICFNLVNGREKSGTDVEIIKEINLVNSRKKSGTDVEVIKEMFAGVEKIERCYYESYTIGITWFGPTNYHLTAMIVLDSDEMKQIAQTYKGERQELQIESQFFDNTGVDENAIWYYNEEFKVLVLHWQFVGDVLYSIEDNALYLDVEIN